MNFQIYAHLSFFLLFFINTHPILQAQNLNLPETNKRNGNVLSQKDFFTQIICYHPIVKSANLFNENARQEIRLAKGNFDPKFVLDYNNKQFNEKNYYNLLDTYLKIPLWIGEFKAAYQQNGGDFVNPENSLPSEGLGALGISVPIGQGLLIDQRRAVLQQAKYFAQIAEADRIKEINKILLNAAKDYWEWYFYYHQFLLSRLGFDLAKTRFEAVKQRVVLGELAAIDSVEAKITLQDREIQLRQAALEYKNAGISLSAYLWTENESPLELAENALPENIETKNQFIVETQVQELLEFAKSNHPEIQKLQMKAKQLAVEQKLQRNNLLPAIQLNYNFLTAVDNRNEYSRGFTENYKLGINVEFPLFLRKERGRWQQVQIKQKQNTFELSQTSREINNNILVIYNDLKNLEQLIHLQEQMLANYQLLRDAEFRKFQNGESSLFLINTRESKLIEAQIKLEELKSKYEQNRAMLFWSAGKLIREQ